MTKLSEFLKDLNENLKSFDPSLSATVNRYEVIVHVNKEPVCLLVLDKYDEVSIEFLDSIGFKGRRGLRQLNGIARSASRLNAEICRSKGKSYYGSQGPVVDKSRSLK